MDDGVLWVVDEVPRLAAFDATSLKPTATFQGDRYASGGSPFVSGPNPAGRTLITPVLSEDLSAATAGLQALDANGPVDVVSFGSERLVGGAVIVRRGTNTVMLAPAFVDGRGMLDVLDPATGERLDQIDIDAAQIIAPNDFTIEPNSALWTVSYDGVLTSVTLDGTVRATRPLAQMVRHAVSDANGGVFATTPKTVVHVGPDGAIEQQRNGYSNLSGLRRCGDRLVVTDVEAGTVEMLGPDDLQPLGELDVPAAWLLDCDDRQAWVANQSAGYVTRQSFDFAAAVP